MKKENLEVTENGIVDDIVLTDDMVDEYTEEYYVDKVEEGKINETPFKIYRKISKREDKSYENYFVKSEIDGNLVVVSLVPTDKKNWQAGYKAMQLLFSDNGVVNFCYRIDIKKNFATGKKEGITVKYFAYGDKYGKNFLVPLKSNQPSDQAFLDLLFHVNDLKIDA